jgi:glyoxylase-like metal-dependent hydrolase (beta-lactamase superfamily II)
MIKTDLGDVSVARAYEWQGHLTTRQQLIPDSDRAHWEANRSWLVPDFWDPETEDAWLTSQSFVVKSADQTILIDTGIAKPRPAVPPFSNLSTGLLGRLAEAGARPDEVDLVVCTHLHIDHVGWNTRLDGDQWVPTFPNATYLFPQADFDYWNPDQRDEPPGGLGESEIVFRDSILPVVYAGQARFFEGTHTIDEHLTIEPAPGHTPGCSVVHLHSGDQRAVFAGDILHTPMEIVRPDEGACFDDDLALAGKTRARLLAQAAAERTLILATHLPAGRAPVISRNEVAYVIDTWVDLA